jgi:phage terminase large subunit-like protein
MRLSQAGLEPQFLASLQANELIRWGHDWPQFVHRHQSVPLVAQNGAPWRTWLILGGRGAGKTRAGAEWVRALAQEASAARIALIGETEHEVREVMVEGVSGLLAVHARSERPTWIPSRRRLEWPNGTVAQTFSAEDPESLRGPQFHAAWADELAKWRQAESTFDVLQFGLRLGGHPRQVITTTPRPIALLKRIMADPATALTRAGTRANARHLSPAFVQDIFARYGGTRFARQELDGEIVEERPDGLWTRALIERARVAAAPPLARIVVAVDPPASAPTPAAWSRPAAPKTAACTCSPTRPRRDCRRPAGPPRRSRSGGGWRRTRSSSRSTRAATWCAR